MKQNARQNAEPENPLVAKSNRLVEAAFSLSLAEQRVILSVLAQINSHPAGKPITGDTPFELTASGFADLFSTSLNSTYAALKDATHRLTDRWIHIDAPDPDDPGLDYTRTRWVSSIDYYEARGRLRIYLASPLIPYVSQLAGAFTRYRIQSIAGMTSVYAIRLYELLVQWQSEGEREVDVEWLKEKFQISDKYTSITDLQRRVIKPAVDQVDKHSNISVRCVPKRVGRRIEKFQFLFREKVRQQVGEISQPVKPRLPQIPSQTEIKKAARPGESWEEVRIRLMREDTVESSP